MEKSKKRIGLNAQGRVAFGLKENKDCLTLADLGFSYDTISFKTGLTTGQVSYRLQKTGKKTRDYRNGIGDGAKMIFKQFKIK